LDHTFTDQLNDMDRLVAYLGVELLLYELSTSYLRL